MAKQHDVLFYTFPCVDLIVPMQARFPVEKSTTTKILTVGNEPGGPGNTLIASGRIGLDIVPIGAIGDDYYGQFLQSAYRSEGIDLSLLEVVPGMETPKALVLIDQDGQHSFISMLEGTPVDSAVFEAPMQSAKAIYLSGYMLAEPCFLKSTLDFYQQARDRGLEIFFDPGPVIAKVDPAIMDQVLAGVTVYVGNDTETGDITGIKDDVEAATAALCARCPGLIVNKAGGRGCYIQRAGEEGRWYPGFNVPLVDTTAAGDSFIAGLMYGHLYGLGERATATLANAMGAAKVRKHGSGTQVPTFDEIVSVLQQGGYSLPDSVHTQRSFATFTL
ncbi:carbohydrate kinase family protein [Neobittarella massiliensis]|uniref:Carbohydrate kinase family protein n=1 Tax=Neobittarella massiliensis (ex Bilen et al. 2018) TaxID=2041842 RepID=A0A8J6IMI7_9FIRM|nr:carbohydrate kinase family protein [Neobittarella massiliensis]MBC3515517.1 carbohydrate kinase family protein [Neobittarella massiliensis]